MVMIGLGMLFTDVVICYDHIAPDEEVEHIHSNSVREHKSHNFLDKHLSLKTHRLWTTYAYAHINDLRKNGYYITS